MCWPLYLQLQSSWEQPQGSLWWSSADVEGRSPHRDAEALGVPAGCPGLRDKAALQAHALACWTLWAGLFFISQPSRYDSRRNLPTNQVCAITRCRFQSHFFLTLTSVSKHISDAIGTFALPILETFCFGGRTGAQRCLSLPFWQL